MIRRQSVARRAQQSSAPVTWRARWRPAFFRKRLMRISIGQRPLLSFRTVTKFMRRRSILLSSLLIGLAASFCIAEARASPMALQSTAVLQGRVVDQNGSVVSGAQVSVQNNSTGLVRKGQTDSEGNFQFAALPVGNQGSKIHTRQEEPHQLSVCLGFWSPGRKLSIGIREAF